MKKSLLTALILIVILGAYAQIPEGINYQCIVRNVTGLPVDSSVVKMRFTIQTSLSGGTVLYSEESLLTTNPFGLVTAVIGTGTPLTGRFDSIKWGSSFTFLKIETDIGNTGTYTTAGTTQMVSVPYALAAKRGGLSYQTLFAGYFVTSVRDTIVAAPDSLIISESGEYLITINVTGDIVEYFDGSYTGGDNELDAYLLQGTYPLVPVVMSNYLRDASDDPSYNLTGKTASLSTIRHLSAGDVMKPGVYINKYGNLPAGAPGGFVNFEANFLKIQ